MDLHERMYKHREIEDNRDAERGKASRERTAVAIAGLAALISVVAAVFTGLQWWVANETRKEVHQDTERTLKVSQRAFIGVQAHVETNQQGKFTRGVTEIIAQGNTPALKVEVKGWCGFMEHSEYMKSQQIPESEWTKVKPLLGSAILMSSRPEEFYCAQQPPPGDQTLFTIGTVTYVDVFDAPHYRKFCSAKWLPALDNGSNPMAPCKAGNEMN